MGCGLSNDLPIGRATSSSGFNFDSLRHARRFLRDACARHGRSVSEFIAADSPDLPTHIVLLDSLAACNQPLPSAGPNSPADLLRGALSTARKVFDSTPTSDGLGTPLRLICSLPLLHPC